MNTKSKGKVTNGVTNVIRRNLIPSKDSVLKYKYLIHTWNIGVVRQIGDNEENHKNIYNVLDVKK